MLPPRRRSAPWLYELDVRSGVLPAEVRGASPPPETELQRRSSGEWQAVALPTVRL